SAGTCKKKPPPDDALTLANGRGSRFGSGAFPICKTGREVNEAVARSRSGRTSSGEMLALTGFIWSQTESATEIGLPAAFQALDALSRKNVLARSCFMKLPMELSRAPFIASTTEEVASAMQNGNMMQHLEFG